jgi:hypothetical protein
MKYASALMEKYQVKTAIRAILDKLGGEQASVMIPAGAILVRLSQPSEKSTTLFGMVGVYWQERHYSVYPNDLLIKAQRVFTA